MGKHSRCVIDILWYALPHEDGGVHFSGPVGGLPFHMDSGGTPSHGGSQN